MRVSVLMFGPARELAGCPEVSVELPDGSRVEAVRAALGADRPELAKALPTMRFAVNQTFAADDRVIRPGDEVALVPPVSGG